MKTGKQFRFRWMSISPEADFSKLSTRSLQFSALILGPMFVTTLYKLIIAPFYIVPTPQESSAYPLAMETFSATPRSNGLFYTLQFTMESIALLAYGIFDVRDIFGLQGRWGWKVGEFDQGGQSRSGDGAQQAVEMAGDEVETQHPHSAAA
ncbi:hypothetical protein BT69DRAFT_562038 [Atractiella rhizophila]|nr:hypothetical protein BT69DRAFT_562038 [Atractiella rhizophila]